jgi:hypothetical protein
MAAAPDLVSPELVLVDPQLAAYTRALHADPAGAFSHVEDPLPSGREPPPVSVPGDAGVDASAEARERLMEGALDSEVLGSLAPSREHFRRRARLIPATAAATSVTLLVLQLYLSHGKLP